MVRTLLPCATRACLKLSGWLGHWCLWLPCNTAAQWHGVFSLILTVYQCTLRNIRSGVLLSLTTCKAYWIISVAAALSEPSRKALCSKSSEVGSQRDARCGQNVCFGRIPPGPALHHRSALQSTARVRTPVCALLEGIESMQTMFITTIIPIIRIVISITNIIIILITITTIIRPLFLLLLVLLLLVYSW